MKHALMIILFFVASITPLRAGAVTEEDFKVKDTQAIMNLCTVTPEDPAYSSAIHFCHGYLVGAYHYHVAESAGDAGKRMVCFPNPAPTRNEVFIMFIDWAKAHPEYLKEMPVETEFRFLIETWPCRK